jgi:3-deoxy-D-manno-octulosonic-acid transferase
MMEPVALGKATVVGPAVEDFRATMDALLEGDAIVQTNRDELGNDLVRLLGDEARRAELAENGRRVIRAHQGATDSNLSLLRSTLRTIRESPPPFSATRTPGGPS